MKIFLTLTLLCSFATASFATVGIPDSRHWVRAWYGGGGTYPMVVPDKFVNHKVYLVSDVSAPFVSTDNGDNWTFLSYNSPATSGWTIQLPTALYQSNTTSTLLYMIGAFGGISKSTDGGTTWTSLGSYQATRSTSGKVIMIDPNNDNIVYAGLDNGDVIKTTDGGATWATLFTPWGLNQKVTWLYVNKTSTKLYVGGGGNGLISYDLNTNTPTTITLTGTNSIQSYDYGTYVDGASVTHLCVTAGWKIACTVNDGASWTYTAGTSVDSNYFTYRLAVRYLANTNVRFISFVRKLNSDSSGSITAYSNDGGATWALPTLTLNLAMDPALAGTNPPINPGGGYAGENVAIDNFNEDVVYFATNGNIFRSDDGGVTYNEKVTGAPNTVSSDVAISPNGTIFGCSMDVGCQYSTDNGVTWTQATPSTNANMGHYWRVITTGTLAEWNAGTGHVIVTATRYNISAKFNWNVIVRSVDNGHTWTFIESTFPTAGLYGDTIWGNGYMRSIGKSSDEQTIYVGMDGATCQANPALAPNCTTNAGYGGIYRSTDNGLNWTRASTTTGQAKVYNGVAVDPTDLTGNTMMYGTFGYNAYRTTTGINPYAYVNGLGYTLDMAYDSQGHPYAVGTESNAPVIYKSVITQYGQGKGEYGTWILMKNFGSSGLLDGLTIDPLNNNRIFVSSLLGTTASHRVYVTADAQDNQNASWTDITGDLPAMGGVQALKVNYNEGAQGFLYAATNGNGLFKLDLTDSPDLAAAGTVKIGRN